MGLGRLCGGIFGLLGLFQDLEDSFRRVRRPPNPSRDRLGDREVVPVAEQRQPVVTLDVCNRHRWDGANQVHATMSQCVAEGTLVLTKRGEVPIEDVTIGDEVWTHVGRWRRVVRFWDQGEREGRLHQGLRQPEVGLRVTPDHKLWARSAKRTRTSRGESLRTVLGEAGWVQAQDLQVVRKGAALASQWSSPCDFGGSSIVPVPDVPQSDHRSNVPDWNSVDLLWLYGLYLAEGSLSTHGKAGAGVNTVAWSGNEAAVAEVEDLLRGAGLRYRQQRSGSHCVTFRVYSRPLATWMVEHGGKPAAGKRVASWIFGLEDKQRDAVLAGYLFGDGHALPEHARAAVGSATCFTVSKALAVDIRLLG